jgi:hypothetical protein
MIQILSHRGYWKSPEEKNTVEAFVRSFSLGYGTETDVRDCLVGGKPRLVISHDIPNGTEISFAYLLSLARQHGSPTPAEGYDNYFLFDSSVPDLIQGVKRGMTSFTRLSEYERVPSLYSEPGITGVWLDNFLPGRWYEAPLVEKLLDDGKLVALVAPDLHRRQDEYEPFLHWLVSSGLRDREGLMICTDFPEKAKELLRV